MGFEYSLILRIYPVPTKYQSGNIHGEGAEYWPRPDLPISRIRRRIFPGTSAVRHGIATSNASTEGNQSMPLDDGLWLDNRECVYHLREWPIMPGEDSAVCRGRSRFRRCTPTQHVQLMP